MVAAEPIAYSVDACTSVKLERRIAERSSVGSVGLPIASPDLRPVIGSMLTFTMKPAIGRLLWPFLHVVAMLVMLGIVYKVDGLANYRASMQSTG